MKTDIYDAIVHDSRLMVERGVEPRYIMLHTSTLRELSNEIYNWRYVYDAKKRNANDIPTVFEIDTEFGKLTIIECMDVPIGAFHIYDFETLHRTMMYGNSYSN